jgi:phosphohistidine phosphatase
VSQTLLLLRHAKSDWPTGVPDRERPLTPRGEKAAKAVGGFLAANDLVPDQVISSPARRALDTAARVLRAAGGKVDLDTDERLYDGAADELLIERLPASGRLLLVGHEPEIAELLMRSTGAQARMPTAALAVIEVELAQLHRLTVDPWPGPCGVLQVLVPPRMLSTG